MAYATFADLKARAGSLGQAWSESSDPSTTDIERILDQVSGELDLFIAGAGYDVPLSDPVGEQALVSVNVDKALLIALDATYVGDAANVKDFRASVKARVDAYDKAMEKGSAPILVYLGQQASGGWEGGAADFWTVDGTDDYYWSNWGARLASWPWLTDQFGVPISQGPAFRKGMSL